jgi:hypothetical protein
MIETKFKRGEAVICIINSRASLTIGKEYVIIGVIDEYGEDNIDLIINNDKNTEEWYRSERFMTKDEFRNITLKQILK